MGGGEPARRSPRKWDLVNKEGAAPAAWRAPQAFVLQQCVRWSFLILLVHLQKQKPSGLWIDWPKRLLSPALVYRGDSCCGGNTFLPVCVTVIWTTCSCGAMAMTEEFRPKLTVMSLTSCSWPHSEETLKGFCCSPLKLSVIMSSLNPPEEDTVLFALISIHSLLTN